MQFRRFSVASVISAAMLVWGIVLISATYILIALLPIMVIAFCIYKLINIFQKTNSGNNVSIDKMYNNAEVIDVEYKIIDK